MIRTSEPTPHVPPFSSAVPRTSSVSPEIQLATLVRDARDAIQSDRDTGHNDEAVDRVAHCGALQRVVAEYTRQMRNLGQYPEKVLVAVKETVLSVATPLVRASSLGALVRDAAQWSIAAYFNANLDNGRR